MIFKTVNGNEGKTKSSDESNKKLTLSQFKMFHHQRKIK